jgi:glycosyltransferase involved in cell wall biosynthesis
MRILIATTHRTVEGGLETYLRELLPDLCRRGHELALLHERPAAANRSRIDQETEVTAWCATSRSIREVIERIYSWRPDVVYAHGLENPDLERLLLAGAPGVLFGHNYHGTCVSGTKRHAAFGCRPCARVLGPACLLLYLPRRCGGLNPGTLLRQYVRQRRRQALLSSYSAVLAASRHMYKEFRKHGVEASRLHLVPLFPTGMRADPQPPSPRSPGGRVLLMGRLTNVKGGDLLVEALRLAQTRLQLPFTLLVAGDGPEKEELQALAKAAGVRTKFLGWVQGSARTKLLRSADLLAVPSTWPEPFGLVGIEAGCVGVPAVAFRLGGIPDWLVPGKSGELAPGEAPAAPALADAVVRALHDGNHWNRLRQGAWNIARHFTRERHLDRLEAILERVGAASACHA